MLKTIVHQSSKLAAYLLALQLALLQPQMDHLTRIADALIVCDTRKLLTVLYRQFVDELDPKTAADFFRESPWRVGDIRQARQRFIVDEMVKLAREVDLAPIIFVSIDDSLGEKDKATRHQDAVTFQHNHNQSTRRKQVYTNGFIYVEVHVQIGPLGFTFQTRLYLREKRVRQLNRQRASGDKLHYRSKYSLAREMLSELADWLPKDFQVYVLFDSWYASAKLIKFCRRQGWHVICALKSNRGLDRKALYRHDQALRHKHYQRVELNAAGGKPARVYYVRSLRGRIKDLPDQVCVLISRRHRGDKYPKYFLCTDLSLSAQEVLRYYQQRWPVEVDNFYLKEALGLSDFRLQSFEATEKWLEVVLLPMNYLQWQQALLYQETQRLPSLADVIRQHRLEHAQDVLCSVADMALKTRDLEAVLKRFIIPDARVVT
jgi:hypothetical protein